jgi:hypothetical protein
MKKCCIAGMTAIAFTLCPTKSIAQSCPAMLRMHGFLSRAQFTCPFRNYSQELLTEVKSCASQLSQDQAVEEVAAGMNTFDIRAKEQGIKQLCKKIADDFSGQVSN